MIELDTTVALIIIIAFEVGLFTLLRGYSQGKRRRLGVIGALREEIKILRLHIEWLEQHAPDPPDPEPKDEWGKDSMGEWNWPDDDPPY